MHSVTNTPRHLYPLFGYESLLLTIKKVANKLRPSASRLRAGCMGGKENRKKKMKLALMKRYDLTENGYRRKFGVSKPEMKDESPDQFIVRLSTYLMRWVELSKTTKSSDGLRDLIVKEKFINSCPKKLAIHLRESAPETLEHITQIANQYMKSTCLVVDEVDHQPQPKRMMTQKNRPFSLPGTVLQVQWSRS